MDLAMELIKGGIETLSHSLDTLWDRFCKLERAVEDLTERVSEIHGMVIHDEPQVQQTTEEFVRVVRCKDCKWWHANVGLCEKQNLLTNDGEDYCSRGERRC